MDPSKGVNLQIGVSWDFFGQGEKVDLDATIVMINDIGDIIDAVYYNKLTSDCGSIVHSGDCRDGAKEAMMKLFQSILSGFHLPFLI